MSDTQRRLLCLAVVLIAGVAPLAVLFLCAACLALVLFGPYTSARPLAGALLVNGRTNSLMSASRAPDAPNVFIDGARWKSLWPGDQRDYIVANQPEQSRFERLAGADHLTTLAISSGKMLLTDPPISGSQNE